MKRIRQLEQLIADGVVADKCNVVSVAVGNVTDTRSAVVIEVLCKLPEGDYEKIKGAQIWFFTPALGVNGWNTRIPLNKAQMI